MKLFYKKKAIALGLKFGVSFMIINREFVVLEQK